jgi:excisionase family DNA binding protein
MPNNYITTREASELCGVHTSSIKRWVRQGIIQAFRTAGGHRRIPALEIYRFLKRQGMPIPEKFVNLARDAYALEEEEERGPGVEGARSQGVEGATGLTWDSRRHSTGALPSLPCILIIGRNGHESFVPKGLEKKYRFVLAADLFEAGMKIERCNPDMILLHTPSAGVTAEKLSQMLRAHEGSIEVREFERHEDVGGIVNRNT